VPEPGGNAASQVLQTLSILIQNIRSETAIFYLFSNNFINELIALRFDFEDDEVKEPTIDPKT
jgi:protein CLEC16A